LPGRFAHEGTDSELSDEESVMEEERDQTTNTRDPRCQAPSRGFQPEGTTVGNHLAEFLAGPTGNILVSRENSKKAGRKATCTVVSGQVDVEASIASGGNQVGALPLTLPIPHHQPNFTAERPPWRY